MAETTDQGAAFNAFEAATWERRAGGYERFFGRVTRRLIEPLLDAVQAAPGHRLLDVGCGPGFVAVAGAERGADAVGVDVAAEMVALARERHPTVEFHQGDAEALGFGDASFDAVVANFALLHFGHPERALAELTRVLCPGGRLALTVWDVPQRCRMLAVIVDAVAEVGASTPANVPPGPAFFRFAEDAEFVRLLRGAGCENVDVRRVEFTQTVRSADELWDGILAGTVRMSTLILDQPSDQQPRIREAFDRLMGTFRSGDHFELPVSVKLASGRKPAGRSHDPDDGRPPSSALRVHPTRLDGRSLSG